MNILSFLAPPCLLVTACVSVAESAEPHGPPAPCAGLEARSGPGAPPAAAGADAAVSTAPATPHTSAPSTTSSLTSAPPASGSLTSAPPTSGSQPSGDEDWAGPQGPGAVTKLGALGFQPAPCSAVVLPDAVPHQDTTGGAHQVLTALSGARESGFVATWRDPRDGSSGLYFQRLNADLEPREPERSTSRPHTMRRADAAVSLAADGSGAIVWTAVLGRGNVPFVRAFDEHGAFEGEDRRAAEIVPLEAGDPVVGRVVADAESCNAPAVLRVSRERTVMAWTRGGRVQWIEPRPAAPELGTVVDVDPNGKTALPGVRLCVSSTGVPVCLWNAADVGPCLSLRREGGFRTQTIGSGTGDAIVADPRGGFWVLVRVGDASVLRHVSPDLVVDRPEISVAASGVGAQTLVAWSGGLAAWIESSAPRGEGRAAAGGAGRGGDTRGTPRLHLLDLDGVARDPRGLDVIPSTAVSPQNALIASDGRRLLVAWTDLRNGDGDVYGRLVDPAAEGDARFLPEKRLNTDTASADQVQGTVAAAGDRAATAWVDRRATPPRVYVRRLSRTGFAGDEFALPLAHAGVAAPVASGGAMRPAIALRADGDLLCAWRVNEGRGKGRLLGQVVALDGTARSGVIEFDDGAQGEPTDPAVVALGGERGYLVGWSRGGGKGVWCRRVTPMGEFQGLLRRVSDPTDRGEGDVDLELLDDGRVICAWTAEQADKATGIRGRFLKDNGESVGDEIGFEHASRFSDWDPALAPADQGGFAMAWTAGANTDPVRDVVVRQYDSRGRPRGAYVTPCFLANEQDFSDLARLSDGSFAVVWEDDVSYADQTYVRRISRDGLSMGPMRGLNEVETSYMPDRVAPRIARFGDGFVAAFGDRRRGQGFDVRVKVVGAKFDAAPSSGGAGSGR